MVCYNINGIVVGTSVIANVVNIVVSNIVVNCILLQLSVEMDTSCVPHASLTFWPTAALKMSSQLVQTAELR